MHAQKASEQSSDSTYQRSAMVWWEERSELDDRPAAKQVRAFENGLEKHNFRCAERCPMTGMPPDCRVARRAEMGKHRQRLRGYETTALSPLPFRLLSWCWKTAPAPALASMCAPVRPALVLPLLQHKLTVQLV